MKFVLMTIMAMLTIAALTLEAAAPQCVVCGKTIKGRYLVNDDKAYCSKSCLESTLPRCDVCGKTIEGPHFRKDNKYYCSKTCLETLFPACHSCGERSANGVLFKAENDYFYCASCAAKPKCFSCMLPAPHGRQLEDGRTICDECDKTAVWTLDDAEKIFKEVRDKMRTDLDIGTGHRIQLRMLDLPAMQRRAPGYAPGMEMGLFVYDATINTIITSQPLSIGEKEKTETFRSNVSYSIYFLSGTPKRKLIEVLAHELSHDWMIENFPQVKSLKIREGFSEYCAWRANILFGQPSMNRRITENTDDIYGNGFKLIKNADDEDGMSAIRRLLRKSN